MELGENFTADRVKRNRREDPFFFRGRVVLNFTSLFLRTFTPSLSSRLSRVSGYVDSRLFNDGESYDDEMDTRRSLILLRRRRYHHHRRRRLLRVVVLAGTSLSAFSLVRLWVTRGRDVVLRFPFKRVFLDF